MTERSGETLPDRLPRHQRMAILAACLIACAQLFRFRDWQYITDDAWITFRIARNGLSAGILTFDLSQPPVEGMTNLLWALLSMIWVGLWPDYDPVIPARLLGAAIFLATIPLVVRVCVREASQAGGDPVVAAWVAAGLTSISCSLAYYAVSGLETALWVFLFAAALNLYAESLRSGGRAALFCGCLLGLLAMTRPEGVAVGGLLCFVALLRESTRSAGWKMTLPFSVIVLGMEGFRLYTYGALVPNTYHAKPPSPGVGLGYVGQYAIYALGIVGPLATFPALRRSLDFPRILAGLLLCLAAMAAWSGGDWMPGFRRLSLATICFIILAAVGTSLAQGKWKVLAGGAALAVVAANLVAAFTLPWNFYNNRVFEQLGGLVEQTQSVEEVAITDIGQFGWYFTGSIFDLVGLTDQHIAKLPGQHGLKKWDEGYFRERNPDLVLLLGKHFKTTPIDGDFSLRPPERMVFASMANNGGYAFYTALPYLPHEEILIFAREGLDLPLDTWGPKSTRNLFREANAWMSSRPE